VKMNIIITLKMMLHIRKIYVYSEKKSINPVTYTINKQP
jgi:hypothetical protein